MRRLPIAIIMILTVALGGCSSVSSPGSGTAPVFINPAPGGPALTAKSRYQLAPTFTALVVPEYVPGREFDLVNLAKAECAGKSFCAVAFWNDDTLAPRKLRMSAVQAASRRAQFVFNTRSGLSRALWDCSSVTSIAGECL